MIMITGFNRDIVNYGVLGIVSTARKVVSGLHNTQNKPGNSQNRGFGYIGKGAK